MIELTIDKLEINKLRMASRLQVFGYIGASSWVLKIGKIINLVLRRLYSSLSGRVDVDKFVAIYDQKSHDIHLEPKNSISHNTIAQVPLPALSFIHSR